MLAKCVLTILELNQNQHFRGKRTKLNICHHMLMSSTQLQNIPFSSSFHVVERTRMSAKCPKMKNAHAKHAKLLFFIVKHANWWRSCCRHRCGYVNSLLSSLDYSVGFVRLSTYAVDSIVQPLSNWGLMKKLSNTEMQT